MTNTEIRDILIQRRQEELNHCDEYMRLATDMHDSNKKVCAVLKDIAHEESSHAMLLQCLMEGLES